MCTWHKVTNYPLFLVSVQINSSVPTSPTVGMNYAITCRVYGTDSPITAYRWMKDGIQLANEMQETLSFSPIRLSDTGQYTCEVTVQNMKYTTVKEIAIDSKQYYNSFYSLYNLSTLIFGSSISNGGCYKYSTQPSSTCWI